MNSTLHHLSGQEHATVLAALRFYQMQGLADDPALRPDIIHDIATGCDGSVVSLNGSGIDVLCERLNTNDPTTRTVQVLRLAIGRAEAELGRWPETGTGSTEHRPCARPSVGIRKHWIASPEPIPMPAPGDWHRPGAGEATKKAETLWAARTNRRLGGEASTGSTRWMIGAPRPRLCPQPSRYCSLRCAPP
ncbi:MAG: hypothetical protein JNG82_08620 [Opitutaceae bacterium]|jgi:hypothetical protein|nr:hypothetical protein [Opitutaceae bacterium]HRG54987.1 hypothetical protein [Lacunisphaera sp.]